MKKDLFGKLTNAEAEIISNLWYDWQSSKTDADRRMNAMSLITLLHCFALYHKTNIATVWNWCFY